MYIPDYNECKARAAKQPQYIPDYNECKARAANSPFYGSYRPSINQEAYKTAFSKDDPLAAFDPQKQEQLRQMLDLYDDPASEAKKQLLSHFLSTRAQMSPEMVYDNFDHAARVYNGGKPIGVEALWSKARELFAPKEQNSEYNMMAGNGDNSFNRITGVSPQESYKEALEHDRDNKGLAALESGAFSLLSSIKMFPVLVKDINDAYMNWNASIMGLKPVYGIADQKVRHDFIEEADTYNKAAQYEKQKYSNGKGIYESFKQDGAAAGAEQLIYAAAENAPQLAFQTIFTLANPVAGAGFMGASAAGGKYSQIHDDDTMSQGAKFTNVGLTSGAEFLGEYFFSTPLIRAMFGKAPKTKLIQGFSRAFGKIIKNKGGTVLTGVSMEAGGEMITQLSANLADMVTGKDGFSFKNMKPGEFTKRLFDGVPDSGLVGGLFGFGFSGTGILHRSYADIDLIQKEARDLTEVRKKELLAKKELSDNEFYELEAIEATETDPVPAPALDMMMDAAGMDIEMKEAIHARRRLQMELNPVIDPEVSAGKIEQAVYDIGFNGRFEIVQNEAALPENVQMASLEHGAERIEGAIDNDTVYFVAGNIPAYRAGKVALHEIVGHYGLHQAFGEKITPLLNQLWNSRAEDIRENAAEHGYDFDFTSDNGRIKATEEFLAKTAESAGKPKWWQEVIAQARKFLRKVMPNMRFTDNDINSLLAKAGRGVRRKNDKNGDIRFSAALRQKGAPNTAGQPGQLRTGNVPYNQQILNHYGIDAPKGLYADYEFLYGRHHKYFKSAEEVKNIVETTLRYPDFAIDENQHVSFLKNKNGKYYKVKIEKKYKNQRNHIRSIFEVSEKQYNQDKKEELPRPASEDSGLMPDSSADLTGNEQKALAARQQDNVDRAQSAGLQLPGEAFPDDSSNNTIIDDSNNVKFSLSNKNLRDYAAAIVPQVRRKEIASTEHLRELYPNLTEGQAENVLIAARELIQKNNKKRNEELFRQWRNDNYPFLDQLEELYPKGIKPDPKYGNKEDITGSYINHTGGEASDLAAQALNMDEEQLIESLNGLTKQRLRKEYNKLYGNKAQKLRAEIEAVRHRRGEVDQLKNDILNGVKSPEPWQLRKFPEMSDFFEELISGETKFNGSDIALARIAALSDPAADSSEMLDRYRILRHVQYIKESAPDKHDSAAARQYIADYARKFMPKEEQHRIVKYLKKDNITPGELKSALREIEDYEMQGSRMEALKKELDSTLTQMRKISRRMLRDHYDRLEVADELQEAAKGLPDDVRKGELNKIIRLLAKASTASTQSHNVRRVEMLDSNGLPVLDENGNQVYKQKLDENGKPRFSQDGKPLYEWEKHPDGRSELDRLIDDAYKVVNAAAVRSAKTNNIEQVKKLFDWVKVGKTLKGIPQGKLTPEIQKTVDGWRVVSQMPPSRIADAKQELLQKLYDPEAFTKEGEKIDPDNQGAREKLAALDMFGDLEHKSLEQTQEALQTLEHVINNGRDILKEQIQNKLQEKIIERQKVIDEFTGGRGLLSDREEALTAEKRKRGLHKVSELGKKFHRANLSFEFFLNSLTRLNKEFQTLKSPMVKKYSEMVHNSTQTESTAIREKRKDLINLFEKHFGVTGRALDRKINNYKKFQEHTGVFRYKNSKHPIISMYVKEAEDLINSLPENDPERLKLETAVKRAKMDNKRKIKIADGVELGSAEEVPMSQDEAVQYWLTWHQEDKRVNMTKHGWTDVSINQLENFVGENIKIGHELRKRYEAGYYSIDDVFIHNFHVHLPQIKNYAPAIFDVGGDNKTMMPDAHNGMSGINPGSLISRKTHGYKVKRMGASDVYLMHTYQMEHWKAWADTVHHLRGIFCGEEVRKAIQQHYGDSAYRQLMEKIDHFADGGNRKAVNHALVDILIKSFVASKLSFNIGVFVKQLTSLPAYAMDIPMRSYLKYTTEFWADPVKNAKFLIESSDYIKNRWGEGYERDVMRLLRDTAKKRNVLNRAIDAGMILGKAGDIIPILIGGHAVYQHYYKKLVRDGVHPNDAHKQAMLEFEMSTDRTQQSGNMKDLGLLQSGGSYSRLFTLFQTSLRQYYQSASESIADSVAGKKKNTPVAIKKIFIAFVVLPTLFQAANDIMSKGADDDEYDFGDYLAAIAAAPLNGLFMVGNIVDEISSALFTGKTWGSNDSAIPFSDKQYLYRAVARIAQIASDDDWDEEDTAKVADELARGTSAVFAPSTAYAILRREYKRFMNIFDHKRKPKRRYK